MDRLGEDIISHITGKGSILYNKFIKSSRKRQKTQWENCQRWIGKLEKYMSNKYTYEETKKYKFKN